MTAMQTDEKICLDRLLFAHYQHNNLASMNKFLTDFGLRIVQETDQLIYYRGFGENPYIYIGEKSPDTSRHFIGGGWVVNSYADLERALQYPGASPIQKSIAPGGGQFVDLKDPNGTNVRLVHGISYRSITDQEAEIPAPVIFNTWEDKPRKGNFQRFETGPSKVHKLGHYGMTVDKSKFASTLQWYLDVFNFAPSDTLYDPQSGEDMMTFLHIDKGEQFVDHHSFFIQSPPQPVKTPHPHHSSFEIDNMDSQVVGHYYLQRQGWTNAWGIGRHLFGSQIFDYWFDASGNIVEHYSDGDLVNCNSKVSRDAAELDTMAAWGPNVPLAFLTGRIEDVKRGAAIDNIQPSSVAT